MKLALFGPLMIHQQMMTGTVYFVQQKVCEQLPPPTTLLHVYNKISIHPNSWAFSPLMVLFSSVSL
jgi:hypothetical protein